MICVLWCLSFGRLCKLCSTNVWYTPILLSACRQSLNCHLSPLHCGYMPSLKVRQSRGCLRFLMSSRQCEAMWSNCPNLATPPIIFINSTFWVFVSGVAVWCFTNLEAVLPFNGITRAVICGAMGENGELPLQALLPTALPQSWSRPRQKEISYTGSIHHYLVLTLIFFSFSEMWCL